MFKMISFAIKYWKIMIAIVALLFVQAFCELSLPQYTSDIVDVGIQSSGLDSPVPTVIREETAQKLLLLMEQEDARTFQDAYTVIDQDSLSTKEYQDTLKEYPALADGPLWQLKSTVKGEALSQLEAILTPAETAFLMLTSDGEEYQQMQQAILASFGASGTDQSLWDVFSSLPDEARNQFLSAIKEQIGDMSQLMGDQIGVAFVEAEYEEIGISLSDIQMNYLFSSGLKMLLLAFLAMAVSVTVGFLASRLAAGTSRDLRNRVFRKVVSFSNQEIDQFSTASLITRSTNDIQQIQMVLVLLFRMVFYAPIIGIGGIFRVLNTNVSMTWIIAVAVLSILLLVILLMIIAMPKFKKMQTLVDRLNLVAREILTGIPVIRAFSREKYEEKRFDDANTALMKTQLFTNRAMTFMMPVMMLIMNSITILIVWVGAGKIDAGTLQVGDMMAFITYTMQIVMAFLMITMVSVMLPRASVAAQRVNEILETKPVITDPEKPADIRRIQKGEVAFHHVCFAYPDAKENALHDIDFTAKPGETTAIIGSTGCGKSTLVNLIPRLYDVTEGSITIDGTDIRNFSQKDLRDRIGFVPQKGVLFSGTISSNLRFGAQNASDDQIQEAARIAQAADFIEEKPEQYESPIAQGGTNVSGGQKQRLSIARAIAKEPKIYVFDDSFSALDYKTDTALRRALSEKTKESTVIIVAQRISTILHAEKIIVLDEGHIAGIGTHEELLKNNEIYRQIASSQLSEKELAGNTGKEAF